MQSENISLRITKLLFILMAVLLFSTCKTLEPLPEDYLTARDTAFRDYVAKDSMTIADIPWKELFTDVHLQALIEEAISNNSDLKIAVARMDKAGATLRQGRLAFLPSLEMDGTASFKNVNSDGSGNSQTFSLYGSSGWELDLFGKLRSTSRANLNAYYESEAYKHLVQTELIAGVATYYYTLLALDSQLAITGQTYANRSALVETMKILKETDVVTGADLVQSQANMYSAQVTIPDLQQSIFETENALCILIGRIPGHIERSTLAGQDISVEIKTGFPAQLLANRPDVIEAEYNLRYAFEMTNVARSYFYPSLNITASGGLTGDDLAQLFNAPDLFWNVASGLAQPLFNKGQNRLRLELARATQAESMETFKHTLLMASSEVAGAIHDYQGAGEKIRIREKQIEYLEKSVDYTMELLKYTSSTNYTDVLTSENTLLAARLGAVSDRLQQLTAVVTLYRSLGGGWKDTGN